MKKVLPWLGIAAVLIPFAVMAQIPPSGGLPNTDVTDLTGIKNKICNIAGWFFTFLIVLAVIFVIVAAFRYLFAGGDPEKVKNANRALIYAAVAVGVAILAKAIPAIVGVFLGAGTIGSC